MGNKIRIETCECKVYEVDENDIDKCPECKSENIDCTNRTYGIYECFDCGIEYEIE